MTAVLEKTIYLPPSRVDSEGYLGYADAFCLFMDLAAEHADLLGIGMGDLAARSLFWLTAKTKAVFIRRPNLGETILLRTWPEAPERIACNRNYEFCGEDGSVMVRGKTEWVLLNTETHRVSRTAGVFPEDLDYLKGSACPEPFSRIPDDFDDAAPYAEYAVRSIDIDIGGHMNNAAYVRALIGTFSTDALRNAPPRSIEVLYRESCYEGDLISFQRKETGTGRDYRLSKDGKTVLLARID